MLPQRGELSMEEQPGVPSLEGREGPAVDSVLERLRAIQTVTEAALAHLSLDDLLPELLSRVRDILATDTVAALLISEDRKTLIARAAKGLEEEVERGVRVPVGAGFAGRIAAERRPFVLDDVRPTDVVNPILIEKGIRSLAGVPLLVEGRVIGVMHVGSLRPRRFTSDEVSLLQIVGDRVALAIEHARAYEAAVKASFEARAAEETARAREEFLAIAAHELKTPMTSAKAAVQLLQRSFAGSVALEAAQARWLDTVGRQIDKMAELVAQLLDAVRLQTSPVTIRRTDTDVSALVRDVIAQVQTTTTEHEIVFSGPSNAQASIDAIRVEQVVRNLLDNAVKFSPRGGSIGVELAHPTSRSVRISVRDRGLGIAPEKRARLFERFYQAHPDRSGMGLGLFISRQIVEGHGGSIEAEFPLDGGTRFLVTLPFDEPQGDEKSP